MTGPFLKSADRVREEKWFCKMKCEVYKPLTVANRIPSKFSPYEIFGTQSGPGTGFSPTVSVLPCQVHSTNAACSSSRVALTGRTNGRSLGTCSAV